MSNVFMYLPIDKYNKYLPTNVTYVQALGISIIPLILKYTHKLYKCVNVS